MRAAAPQLTGWTQYVLFGDVMMQALPARWPSTRGFSHPGPFRPVLGPRSGHQSPLHPADLSGTRRGEKGGLQMGKRGPCVGGSPGRDRLQHHDCCSRFIGQNLVTGRVQLPGSLATVGSLWPRRKRDTDAGAVTVPATPSGSALSPRVPGYTPEPFLPWLFSVL